MSMSQTLQELKDVMSSCRLDSKIIFNRRRESVPDLPEGVTVDELIHYLQAKKIPLVRLPQMLSVAEFLDIPNHVAAMEVYLDDFTDYSVKSDLFTAFIEYEYINYAYLESQSEIATRGAAMGLVEVLKYPKKRGDVIGEKASAAAARGGHLECLKYLSDNGCPFGRHITHSAAKRGYYDCLKYLHSIKCPLNKKSMYSAAKKRELKCLIFLHEVGLPLDENVSYEVAKNGHIHCLRYLYKKDCPWNEETMWYAARYGRTKCVRFLDVADCRWNIRAVHIAEKKMVIRNA